MTSSRTYPLDAKNMIGLTAINIPI
jgi:hypothetical protein